MKLWSKAAAIKARERLMTTRTVEAIEWSPNERAYAIGRLYRRTGRFHIRRVVWGRLLAREEKRAGETIRRALILITGK